MKIAGKIILTLSLFTALNLIYESTAFQAFVEEEAGQYAQVHKIAACDVIYVSESSNFSPDNSNDTNRRKLSQFISDFYPTLQFEAINQPAAHAGIYRALLDLFPDDAEVKTVVVAINLRSFNADWINSELETALQKSMTVYNHRPPLWNRFLVSLNAYDDTPLEERLERRAWHWDHDPLPYSAPHHNVNAWCAEEKWGDWRDPKRQLADQFIKQYAFVLDENNPRIPDLDAIVEIANERNWNLCFSILAENMEKADSLVGDDLTNLMRSNTEWLKERYKQKGVTVLNNLEELPSEHFTDKDFPTEHYDEAGRKKLATNVAFYLLKFHKDQYQSAPWDTTIINIRT